MARGIFEEKLGNLTLKTLTLVFQNLSAKEAGLSLSQGVLHRDIGSGLEIGQERPVFTEVVAVRFLIILITSVKNCSYLLPICFASRNTLPLTISTARESRASNLASYCDHCVTCFRGWSAGTWSLSVKNVIIPIVTREPSSVTSFTISPTHDRLHGHGSCAGAQSSALRRAPRVV